MARLSAEMADLLHQLTGSAIINDLKAAMAATETHEDGSVTPVPVPPALIDKALKFLKDNEVTAPASNKAKSNLAETLGGLNLDTDQLAVEQRIN